MENKPLALSHSVRKTTYGNIQTTFLCMYFSLDPPQTPKDFHIQISHWLWCHYMTMKKFYTMKASEIT